MTEVQTPKLSSIKIHHLQGQCTDGSFTIGTNTTVHFEGDHDFRMAIRVMASGECHPESKAFDSYQARWETLCKSKTTEAKQVSESISCVLPLPDDSNLHHLATEAFALGWTDWSAADRTDLQSRQADNQITAESMGRLSGYVGRALLSLIKIELSHTARVGHDEGLNLFQYGPKADWYSEHDRASCCGRHRRSKVTFEDESYTSQLRAKLIPKQIENGQKSGNSMPESTSSHPGIKLLGSSSS